MSEQSTSSEPLATTPHRETPPTASQLGARPLGEESDPSYLATEANEEPEEHIHLPPPTIWPVVTAGGVALAGMGLVSVWWMAVIGLLLMVYGIISWVQELRHELPH